MSGPVGRDLTRERTEALAIATELFVAGAFSQRVAQTGVEGAVRDFLLTGDRVFRWMIGPVAMFFTFGPVLDQNTGMPTGTEIRRFPMQLHDNEQVDLTVTVTDAKGASIGDDPASADDNVSWSIDDESVATLQVSADSRTCTLVAGMPGSAVVTVGLGSLTATLAVDTVPGDAALLTVNAGTPVPQQTAGDTTGTDGGTDTSTGL